MDGQFTATLNIADNQLPRGVFVTADQSVIIRSGSAGSDKILIIKEGEKLISFRRKGRKQPTNGCFHGYRGVCGGGGSLEQKTYTHAYNYCSFLTALAFW